MHQLSLENHMKKKLHSYTLKQLYTYIMYMTFVMHLGTSI